MKLVNNDNNFEDDVYVRDRDFDGNGVLDEAVTRRCQDLSGQRQHLRHGRATTPAPIPR